MKQKRSTDSHRDWKNHHQAGQGDGAYKRQRAALVRPRAVVFMVLRLLLSVGKAFREITRLVRKGEYGFWGDRYRKPVLPP